MVERKIDLTKSILSNDRKAYHALRGICHCFDAVDAQIYLVGGCVRDMLLGKKPNDYDLCTNLSPNEVKKLFDDENRCIDETRYAFIETGLKHGTVTVHDNEYDMSFEITTYRVDADYSDHRHPDSVEFTSNLEDDLKRRDFTINSFAYDFFKCVVIALEDSYFDDLKCGIVRAVGDANSRFEEDALRMLRAIRFCAQLKFLIDSRTYFGIRECAPSISMVSRERIRDEFTKILMSDCPYMLELVISTGLDKYIFAQTSNPEFMSQMLSCEQHSKYHYTDVFHHTIDVVEKLPKVKRLRWAGFLHDVGKIESKTTKDGVDHFYGHAKVGSRFANEVLNYLKFDNETIDLVTKYVELHDYPWKDVGVRKFKKHLVEIGVDNFDEFIDLMKCDAMAHSLEYVCSLLYSVQTAYSRFRKIIDDDEPLFLSDLAVDGDDMLALGASGRKIGEILQKLLDFVLENANNNTRDKLISKAKTLIPHAGLNEDRKE